MNAEQKIHIQQLLKGRSPSSPSATVIPQTRVRLIAGLMFYCPVTNPQKMLTLYMEISVQVGVIMGSSSDWETMKFTCLVLEELQIPYEKKVVSAHRTPDYMFSYAEKAAEKGLKVIVAGAGGAAHLPGMVASKTNLPVIGVPVQSKALNGLDSLLSIVQMPGGVPVATVAIGTAGATNAGLLAAQIIGASDRDVYRRLQDRRSKIEKSVLESELPES